MFGGPGYLTYPSFIKALSEVSYYRGGSELYGSCIWADLMEQGELENQIPSIVQVFGHTMVLEPFNYNDSIYSIVQFADKVEAFVPKKEQSINE